jgi:hypothetical protein
MRSFAFALCALAGLAARGDAGVAVAEKFPKQGVATTVTVTQDDGSPLAGAAVTAVYRPGSNVSHTETLGSTGAEGTVSWTPGDAGLVSLQATPPPTPDTPQPAPMSVNLSVLYAGVPRNGLIVLLAAGFLLYGGVIWGFAKLNSLPPNLPPDT